MAAGLRLHRAGRLAEAEAAYALVRSADPAFADALHLSGVIAHQRGDHRGGAERIAAAIARNGRVAEYHANLALALQALGDLEAAIAAGGSALALRPDYAEAYNNRGSAHQQYGAIERARRDYARAAALRPDYPAALVNMATTLHALDQAEPAARLLRRALRLDPANATAQADLGAVLKALGRPAEAEAALQEALRLVPGDPEALVNLALLREAAGRPAEADAFYRHALVCHPGQPLAAWNLALLRLRQGRVAEGWALYAARFAARGAGDAAALARPLWGGEPLDGRHLFVWREQGLGDELMFGTLLPDLAARCGRLTVACDRRLVGLLARSLPGVAVRPDATDAAGRPVLPADADVQAPMGDLPALLRPALTAFPARLSWLRPDPARATAWRARLDALGPGLRIGLCWRSRVSSGERRHAYTPVETWAPLFAVPGVTYVCLQYDVREEEIAAVSDRFGVTLRRWPDADLMNDLEAAAALTAGLDLVISVASSVGEMAGALGVPVWRIAGAGDWTALGSGCRPWFPSMRIIAPRPGEGLDSAVAEAAARLRALLAPPPAGATALLETARRHQAAGRGPQAEAAYQRALALTPGDGAAWEAYAGLATDAGRPDIAATLFTRAGATAGSTAAWSGLAQARQALGQVAAAERAYGGTLCLLPADAVALGNRASLRLALGWVSDAVRDAERALRLAPDWPALHANAAAALAAAGRSGAALVALRRALTLDPALADAWNSRGHLLTDGQAAAALLCAGRALTLRPSYAEAYGTRAAALAALGRAEAALADRRSAARLRPADPATLVNLALGQEVAGRLDAAALVWWRLVLLDPGDPTGFAGLADLRARQNRGEAAVRAWSRCLALAPGRADWRYNLGNALLGLGRRAEADAAYRRAAEDDPSLTLATFNRGYAALAAGAQREGWAGLEARFAAGRALPDRRFRLPRWDGGDPAGRPLLVWREQGVGDELMFASCYGDLIARAGHVVIECEPRLVGLFARSFPAATVRAETADPDDADAEVPAGSLPYLLRPGLAAYPARPGWLIADPARLALWRRRLDGLPLGLRVGIAWRSGLGGAGRTAACPPLDRWGPLLRLPGVVAVNLQYDECAAEIAAAEAAFGIRIHRWPEIDLKTDLEEAAALTAALDLVVSAGTSVAEMAGALGVPVWRIGAAGEWTALGTAVRPFYPAMRLWSPRPDEAADGTMQRLAEALARLRPHEAAPLSPQAPDPDALVARALPLHRAGRLAEAESLYRAALDARPGHADALHLLGMVAVQEGRFAEAVEAIGAALKRNGRVPDWHANHALALLSAGRPAEAEAAARRALRLDPRHAEAANTLGNALAAQGRAAAALPAYREALRVRPAYPQAAANLGQALFSLGRAAEAEGHLRAALSADAVLPEVPLVLGALLLGGGRPTEALPLLRRAVRERPAHAPALAAYARLLHGLGEGAAFTVWRRALALAPAEAGAWNSAGLCFQAADRIVEAAAAFARAALLDPALLEALSNLGNMRRLQGRAADAAALQRTVLARRPEDAAALTNLGLVLQEQGDGTAAEAAFDAALRHAPGQALAAFNRGLLRLGRGRLAEGWADHESRFASAQLFAPRRFPVPEWQGEDPAALALLVWREQGLGDELMFASCYPELIARAGRVTIECDRRLHSLFARSLPAATVRPAGSGPADVDRHVAAGSLPLHLRPSLAGFPGRGGWLRPDPVRLAAWQERLAALGPGLRVGIAWTSRRVDATRRHAYTALADWQPLLTLPGVLPVSLQYDGHTPRITAEIAAVGAACRVTVHRFPDTDLTDDLEAAAALTASLDLVVTVASSVGEMAGALGVPVWRLGGPDWTWLGTGVRPWYPTMRTLAPRPAERLADVIVRAARDLHGRMRGMSP